MPFTVPQSASAFQADSDPAAFLKSPKIWINRTNKNYVKNVKLLSRLSVAHSGMCCLFGIRQNVTAVFTVWLISE